MVTRQFAVNVILSGPGTVRFVMRFVLTVERQALLLVSLLSTGATVRLSQLCCLKESRQRIKDAVYPVLRELHTNFETDQQNIEAIHKVVDVLINTERRPDMESLHTVDVPLDLKERFREEEDRCCRDESGELFLHGSEGSV